ncbi:MAG: site-specific DNA-methyltransferase [Candidatus Brocadiae bacterium]|nr:site-specific DNA-methyltransferase [Candidatus Brocadiia bacterium]
MLSRYAPGATLTDASLKSVIPSLAKMEDASAELETLLRDIPTHHRVACADARQLSSLASGSVHLIVTSPPYWTLKEYNHPEGQLGDIESYATFVEELAQVWNECHRVLVPGGRLVVVVGDVCLARRKHGRHAVMPLHASIQESCRKIGFTNLAPIIWAKIANASLETSNGSSFLGKPYEPNSIIKNDIEYILMQRKEGGYRSPDTAARVLSVIPAKLHHEWFRQVWAIPGASTKEHPAPFPLELATRLVRMFSFVGDTVLDPFLGTGTTCLAASICGRNSIGLDIDPEYVQMAYRRLRAEHDRLFSNATIDRSDKWSES